MSVILSLVIYATPVESITRAGNTSTLLIPFADSSKCSQAKLKLEEKYTLIIDKHYKFQAIGVCLDQ
jgi:hypothetical protein